MNPETGKPVQEQRYRLKDNYARFYLKYIEPKMSIIQRGGYQFVSLEQLPEWDAVKGLALLSGLKIWCFPDLWYRL